MEKDSPTVQREYWRFYWPLALTGMLMLVADQFENRTLAGYPDAEQQLAVLAFAVGIFGPFRALLVFVPQMVNVLARSRRGHRVCLTFTVAACGVISLPLGMLAFTPPGREVVRWSFSLDEATLAVVVTYIRVLSPLVLVTGLRQYATGILVQARQTRAVTVLNLLHMATVIGMLHVGIAVRWPAWKTVALAQVSAAGVHVALSGLACVKWYRLPTRREHADLTHGQVMAFFWPVAATSLMFALSRPVLYAFINRTEHAKATIAAMRVAFSFAMFFHAPVNQFRHLFVTFGREDPQGIRRFMTRVMLLVAAAMAIVAFTPLGRLFFANFLGVRGRTLTMACQALMVLCATPVVITARNYFHGRLLTDRRTHGMAVGGVARVGSIAAGGWMLFALGVLDHIWAPVLLQVGFVAEGVVSALFAGPHRVRANLLVAREAGR